MNSIWKVAAQFSGEGRVAALSEHGNGNINDTYLVSVDQGDQGPGLAAWEEARALCDDAFHPLIDALIAAEAPGPDHFGDDLVSGGRVVGAMEFGWSNTHVAVAETSHEGVGWALIPFDPEADQIGEAVSRIITALQEART